MEQTMSQRWIAGVSGIAMAAMLGIGAAPAEAQEPCEDYVHLFNGVNLVGWDTRQGHAKDWYVEDGEIFVAGRSDGGGRMILTNRRYENYDFRMEWKLYEGGNSGVFIRMGEEGEGLEIQLLDDYAERHANLRPEQYSGALYGMAGPMERTTRLPGEWQTIRIRMVDQDLKIWQNSTLIVDTNLDDHVEDTTNQMRLDALQRSAGHIGIQSYGDPGRFRNVKICEL